RRNIEDRRPLESEIARTRGCDRGGCRRPRLETRRIRIERRAAVRERAESDFEEIAPIDHQSFTTAIFSRMCCGFVLNVIGMTPRSLSHDNECFAFCIGE